MLTTELKKECPSQTRVVNRNNLKLRNKRLFIIAIVLVKMGGIVSEINVTHHNYLENILGKK